MSRAYINKLTKKVQSQSKRYTTMQYNFENELASNKKLQELHLQSYKEQLQNSENVRKSCFEKESKLSAALAYIQNMETKCEAISNKSDSDLTVKQTHIDQLTNQITQITNQFEEWKEFQLGEFLSQLCPGASEASRHLTTDVQFTQLFQLYSSKLNDFEQKSLECNLLNLQLKYTKSQVSDGCIELSELASTSKDQLAASIWEQDKLKQLRSNLSRQVCHLLQTIESKMDELNVEKKNITFSDISSLQKTNLKLLQSVQELELKLEKYDDLEVCQTIHEQQRTHLEQRCNDLLQLNELLTKSVNSSQSQTQCFKNLYNQYKNENKRVHELLRAATESYGIHTVKNVTVAQVESDNLENTQQQQEHVKPADKQADEEIDILKKRISNFNRYRDHMLKNESTLREQLDSISEN